MPMVVLIHVARAVATKSVGEKAWPFPLLSLGASVEIFACEGPCVASQRKSPVYLTDTSTIVGHRLTQIFTDSELTQSPFHPEQSVAIGVFEYRLRHSPEASWPERAEYSAWHGRLRFDEGRRNVLGRSNVDATAELAVAHAVKEINH